MIGENHGTNQPAGFVIGLASLLTQKGHKVQIGLEIPPGEMNNYLLSPADSNIYSSEFFTRKTFDIRPSFAWADMIARLNDNPDIEIFFFDPDIIDTHIDNYRDSLMFLTIKKRLQAHPDWKTITLSGNIHNMLLPYAGKKKMGMYLLNDKDLNLSTGILSIRHDYALGKIWESTADGLRLYQSDHHDSVYSKSAGHENYLLLYPANIKSAYNAIYFTRNVTASNMVRERTR
jgi:hypothetical protein